MKLSVCIPTHHGRCALLHEALTSIAAQALDDLGVELEIVVSDNAARDGTQEMVAAFAAEHPHLDLVYGRNEHDIRLGNMLRVIERSSGDWCWPFGSDDLMATDGLAVIAAAMQRFPNCSGIGFMRANFDHAMEHRLEGDGADLRPPEDEVTVFEGFAEIEANLAFQHSVMGTNVVRRDRWLDAAADVGERALAAFPDWPQLVVLGEMARRHPLWLWLPATLVQARSGQPYIVEGDGDQPDLTRVHTTLVAGQRRAWRAIAAGDEVLYRRLMHCTQHTFGDAYQIHHLKLASGHSLRGDLALARTMMRAFWFLPSFRRQAIPLLLTPASVHRRRARRPQLPMPQLAADACRTHLRAELPARWRTRDMLRLNVVVGNDGPLALSSGGDRPIHVGARWFAPDGELLASGERAVLPRVVAPGEEVELTVWVHTPWDPGAYHLQIAPVQELVRWFDDADPASGIAIDVDLEQLSATALLTAPAAPRPSAPAPRTA